jgi:hypothetical protein
VEVKNSPGIEARYLLNELAFIEQIPNFVPASENNPSLPAFFQARNELHLD